MIVQQYFGALEIGNTFVPNSIHTAKANVHNPTSSTLTYDATLYLGLYEGDNWTSDSQSFTLAPGETKEVSFSITMPDVIDETYGVYLDVCHEGVMIAAYQSYQDVRVFLEALIDIISVIWT